MSDKYSSPPKDNYNVSNQGGSQAQQSQHHHLVLSSIQPQVTLLCDVSCLPDSEGTLCVPDSGKLDAGSRQICCLVAHSLQVPFQQPLISHLHACLQYGLSADLAAALDAAAPVKESALVAITAIATTIGQTAAPYLVPLLPALLDKAGDSKVRCRHCAMVLSLHIDQTQQYLSS